MIAFLRKYVFANLGLKLVSLIIAVLLWAAVARDPIAEITVPVPIEFHNMTDGLEISADVPLQAQVRVRGPVTQLRETGQTEVHAMLDLRDVQVGERTFEFTPDKVRVPQGIEVVQVIPSQVRVSFDRRVWRDVPVTPRVVGNFAQGYGLVRATSTPNKVTIVGPEKRVNAIASALTDPVDATGVVNEATFTSKVYVPDAQVRVAKPAPVQVNVVVARGR